jgi:hypothetical protein
LAKITVAYAVTSLLRYRPVTPFHGVVVKISVSRAAMHPFALDGFKFLTNFLTRLLASWRDLVLQGTQ